MSDCTLIVIAKAPVAGRVKTRLSPRCTPEQAAAIAEAALADTLQTVLEAGASRRVCVLDGEPGPWLPAGIEVIPQRSGDFGARLAGAFADVGGPALLIGMDAPQVRPRTLDAATAALHAPGVRAVLGTAEDGGWWALGLRTPDPEVFAGVPMSSSTTGAAQRARLRALGLRTTSLPTLRDVDTMADARAVAALCPPGAAFPVAVAAALRGGRRVAAVA